MREDSHKNGNDVLQSTEQKKRSNWDPRKGQHKNWQDASSFVRRNDSDEFRKHTHARMRTHLLFSFYVIQIGEDLIII